MAGERPATDAAPSMRDRILDVALDLFARKGYADTSLREIAGQLDISKAALYYHFESKQDILGALHLRLHQVGEELWPMLAAEGQDAGAWVLLADALIRIGLHNRRLLEVHARNQDVIGEMHRGDALASHPPVEHDMDQRLMALLTDRSAPVSLRVRRVAALGAIGGVLLGAAGFADVPDHVLEEALRDVAHQLLSGRAPRRPRGRARAAGAAASSRGR